MQIGSNGAAHYREKHAQIALNSQGEKDGLINNKLLYI
jgi:hypothetical protein